MRGLWTPRLRLAIPAFALLFASTACQSTDWEARYLEKEQENRALTEQYDAMNQNLAERDASSEILKQEFDQTRSQLDTLSSELQKLKEQPAPAAMSEPGISAPGMPVPGEYAENERALYEKLKAKYGESVQRTPDGNIEITLNSNVTFRSGSYELTPEGKKTLANVAVELNSDFEGNMIRVIGHTDNDPIRKSPFKDNWELGAERALEVIRYLSSQHGVDPARLVGASRGDTKPVAENGTKEGKSRNRRVEIVVVIPRGESSAPAYSKK